MMNNCYRISCEVLLLVCFILCASPVSGAPATISWISHPVKPGELVQVAGGGFDSDSSVVITDLSDGTQTTVQPLDVLHSALKFKLPPSNRSRAAYNVSIAGSLPAPVNLPDIWWWQGDEGKSSTPGGWLRVFGRSIGVPQNEADESWSASSIEAAISSAVSAGDFARARSLLTEAEASASAPPAVGTRLRLTPVDASQAKPIVLTAQAANTTEWHALFELPTLLRPGLYAAELSCSLAGQEAWTRLEMFVSPEQPARSLVQIEAAPVWKSDVFTVDCMWTRPVFERPCGWVGVRSQKEIDQALSQAKSNGGGIVLLPRGQYYVDGPIVVPDGVQLRGEAEDLVSIYFREHNKDTAPHPGYFFSDSVDSDKWAVRDLTIYITHYYHSVFFVAPTCTSFTLQRVRVRAVAYAHLGASCPGESGRGERLADFKQTDVGEVVYLAGNDNFKILECDLLGTNIIIHTGRNPGDKASATNGIIAHNELWNGNAAHWFDDIKQVIFEHNSIQPGGVGGTWGNNIDNYGSKYCQHIYHAFNSFKQVWFGDREVMTFDPVWPGYYHGPVHADEAGTLLTLTNGTGAANNESQGGAVYVLGGSGMGQYRRVLSLPDQEHILIDRPFDSPLDASSVVQLAAFKGQIIFHGNSYSDSGAFQTYGYASDVIVSATRFERVAGLLSWGRSSGGAVYAPNMRIQFLDNIFIEGNHLWNYNGSYPYPHPKTVEPYNIGVLGSDQDAQICTPYPHMAKDCETTPPQAFQGAINHLIMIRRNVVKSNGGITVRGHTVNVIVEGNVIQNSHVGVHVNETHASHVSVVGNTEVSTATAATLLETVL